MWDIHIYALIKCYGSAYIRTVPTIILGKILKKKKMSKRQFSKLLGVEYRNIFRVFREGYDPKFSTMADWARVLSIKVKDLFEE
jgi:DNA-binding XRE family transcriptional regulator